MFLPWFIPPQAAFGVWHNSQWSNICQFRSSYLRTADIIRGLEDNVVRKHDIEPMTPPEEKINKICSGFLHLADGIKSAGCKYKRCEASEVLFRANKNGARGFVEQAGMKDYLNVADFEKFLLDTAHVLLSDPGSFGYFSGMPKFERNIDGKGGASRRESTLVPVRIWRMENYNRQRMKVRC